MTGGKPVIPFFTDNDVADGVGDFLMAAGHEVTRLRDVIRGDSPDPVVATTCRESDRVLITHNIKDFRNIVKEYGITKKEADRLRRIEMDCKQVDAEARMAVALPLIEVIWQLSGGETEGLRISVKNSLVCVRM